MQFELSYTDGQGKRTTKVIDCDSDTAKKLARELAMSSGRRAILTRVRPQSWKVYVVDGDTRRKSLLWTDLSKREVLMRWRLWDEKGTRAILIAEPNWFRKSSLAQSHRG